MPERKAHWEKVYDTKQPHEVSWTQDIPETSLQLISGFHLPETAKIIDVGGGDSRLVDFLLDRGFYNITVLDISEKALQRAQQRLGERAQRVKWVVSDITGFQPEEAYDVWHDRAAFHFLTTPGQIAGYISVADKAVAGNGYMVIGTFSEQGPQQCSGLEVRRYAEPELEAQLSPRFSKIRCITEDHVTPFNTKQHFLFCSFRKMA